MSAAPIAKPVIVLVDGSNVARCGAWRARVARGTGSARDADDVELRQRLVDAICSWAPTAGVHVELVFDGAGPWRAGKFRATEQVHVIGSGRADGDDVIERRAANAHRGGRAYWIVSTDRALQHVAGARAERVLDADDFVREFVGAASAASRIDVPTAVTLDSAQQATSPLGADLDDEIRAKLERLRRGLDADA